jgi:hypothetical protein
VAVHNVVITLQQQQMLFVVQLGIATTLKQAYLPLMCTLGLLTAQRVYAAPKRRTCSQSKSMKGALQQVKPCAAPTLITEHFVPANIILKKEQDQRQGCS